MRDGSPMIPGQIELIPERLRITESLGRQPEIWSVFFLLSALLIVSGEEYLPPWIPGALTACGLALAGYSVWRRRNRTVLVNAGESVAVYRKGQLDLTLTRNDIVLKKPPLIVALHFGIGLGLSGVIFTAVAIACMADHGGVSADSLLILTAGLALLASFGSAAFVWFCFAHLAIPLRNSRLMAEETLLITRSQLQDLLA